MTSTTGVASRELQESKVDGRSPSTTTESTAARNCTPSRDAFAQCTPVAQPFTTVETRRPHFSAELVMTHHQPPPVAINRPPQHKLDAPPSASLSYSCNCSVCTTLSLLCVAVEIGPNLPAELVMATGLHQSLSIVMDKTPQWHGLIGAPPPAARSCNCDCSVRTQFCMSCFSTVEIGPNSPAELAVVSHLPPPVVQHRMDAPSPAPRRCSCDCLVCMSFRPCMSACHGPTVEESAGQNHAIGCQLCPRWVTLPVQESLSGYDGPSALVWMVTAKISFELLCLPLLHSANMMIQSLPPPIVFNPLPIVSPLSFGLCKKFWLFNLSLHSL